MIIETTCFLIDRKLTEIGIEQSGESVRFSFDTDRIESVRETYDNKDEVSKEECIIYFKSGESIVVGMSYDEVIKKWKT